MKIFSLTVLFLAAAAPLSAADAVPATECIRLGITVDSEFKVPYGGQWWMNRGVSDKGSSVSIVKDEKTGSKCLKLFVPEGKKNVSACATPDFLYVKDGILEMKANFKGKASFCFDFYCYDGKNKYIGIHGVPKIEINSDDWKEIKTSIPMSKFPKNTAKLRAVLSLRSSGTVLVDDVVYSVSKPKK